LEGTGKEEGVVAGNGYGGRRSMAAGKVAGDGEEAPRAAHSGSGDN